MKKKMPDDAKVVFEGIRHIVYQWEEIMFDGTKGLFEAVKRKDGVTIIAMVGDQIMVNIEEQPFIGRFLGLPAGEVEQEGTLLVNAQRELLEETGYTSEVWQKWFTDELQTSARFVFNNHFFIARDCKKVGEPRFDSGERVEVVLRSFDEFLTMHAHPDFRNVELISILEKATNDEQEKRKLKETLFGVANQY